MDRLEALLARIGTDNPPADEELAAAKTDAVELLKAAAGADTPDIESAKAIKAAIDSISAEVKTRTETAEKVKAEAAQLLESVVPDVEPEAEVVPETIPEALPVAASLGAALRKTRAGIEQNAQVETKSNVRVTNMGVARGWGLTDKSTMEDVAKVFSSEARQVQQGRQSLVRLSFDYPDDRILSRQTGETTKAINNVFTPENLKYTNIAAAGGICGPLTPDFSNPICGERGRPIRDALTRFNADRGGIRYQPAASLADVSGGITVWPIATDESPGSDDKACLVLDCDEEVEAKVDAVVACVQIGNFAAKFTPEFYRARLDVLMIAHDRIAEQTLYAQILTGSTATTYAGADGTIYSVLSAVDKAVAGLRSRLRLLPGAGFRMIAPQWVRDALRSDLAKQRIGGNLDALQAANSILDNFFAVRGVTAVWSPDLDVFGAQGAAPLLDYPGASTQVIVYPEGTFMFLDGGTLDLGTEITDSTLNKTNDRQAFVETFEKAVKRGCESLAITVPIAEACQCPEVLDLGSLA
jgi:hypothetical protein